MRIFPGAGTRIVGEWAMTIEPTTRQEARRLRRSAAKAAGRMAEKPTVIMPHRSEEVILSFREPITPRSALSKFRQQLDSCDE